MSDSKQARVLLEAARRDLRALEGMRDSAVFADEIFGFHAQQAAEKLLKAWLAIEGVLYPRTHDLDHLLRLLEQHGAQLSGLKTWRSTARSRSNCGMRPSTQMRNPSTVMWP